MTKLHAGDKAPDFRLSNQDEKDVNLAEYKGRMNEMKEGQAEKRNAVTESSSRPSFAFSEDSFSRLDESDDSIFYSRDRFVKHLDSLALSTVEKIIQELVIEKTPAILDLMASWDSHIPPTIQAETVVGLGLNRNELARNETLTDWVYHDLNKDPSLPFPDNTFDVVLNVVSVDYMTKPFDVFREVNRILKPGGLFLVIFSSRLFEQKAVKIWRQSSERERILLVEEFFTRDGTFTRPQLFTSKGKPRPKDDKYAHLGIPSDPIYAVYAEKKGDKRQERPRPTSAESYEYTPDPEELQRRKAAVKHTLRCPHCEQSMLKWAVPQSPFTQWDVDFMYVCFNDECPYLVQGWEVMKQQGNSGISYRFTYNSYRDNCLSVPVPHLHALKEGIID
ncbi:MAG: methyltransferase domain-containing protein [Deltaproteobacteria bacterium]|nr:methyltransferase domain-containing protein [Deltaproteobacteria bacterium]MDH3929611.1 methyltransferase domain-containing protein [Deltaproteobacteria bacterium]MDH3964515.1 methyltransferase domain-containing protein [Deltaproteobacteria bacterium]